MRMMEAEARALLKAHGWSLIRRKRRAQEYLYARKWGYKELYLSSLKKLPALTEEEVLGKITRAS